MCALVPGFQSFALPVSVLLGRFRRPVRQIARPSAHVELPAVIDAAQPALLVAPVVEVRAAMRAARLHETHPAEAVAERDQVLAEDADANRRPVRLRQLRGEDGGRSEEHTSELQSLMRISYAVFCLKKKRMESLHPTHQSSNIYRQYINARSTSTH